MNRATLIGNLTRDPEVRMTGNGISVCTFSVAVQRRFANAQGERQADFFNIVAWRTLADNCGRYLKKGSKVFVGGSMQNRSYDKDGVKRYIMEIIADEVEFLSPVEKRAQGATEPDTGMQDEGAEYGTEITDDDLPF